MCLRLALGNMKRRLEHQEAYCPLPLLPPGYMPGVLEAVALRHPPELDTAAAEQSHRHLGLDEKPMGEEVEVD